MSRRTVIWGLAVAALAAPPVDAWLDRQMPRLLLVSMPAWIALGWLAGRRLRLRARVCDPHGMAGLLFFMGALGFWLIPRSVDAIADSGLVDTLMHASLLAGGAALGTSVPSLPFVVRGMLAIYGAAMTLSMGLLYSGYRGLLCGTFDLAQQRSTGHWLLVAFPPVVVLVVGAGARALLRVGPHAAQTG